MRGSDSKSSNSTAGGDDGRGGHHRRRRHGEPRPRRRRPRRRRRRRRGRASAGAGSTPAAGGVRPDRRRLQGHRRLRARPDGLPGGLGSQAGHHRHRDQAVHEPADVAARSPGSVCIADGSQGLLQLHQRPTAASTAARSSSTPRTTATSRTRPRRTSTRRSARTSTRRSTTMLGTPNNLAIWDEINDECMPQLFNGTGAAAVG